MDWLSLLDRIAEYYQWRRDHHPPYPDLRLEWGLFHDLRGRLRDELGAEGAADIAEADAILADLDRSERGFPDVDRWRDWRRKKITPGGEAPSAEILAAHFRENMDLAGGPELDFLIAAVAPLEAAPVALRRAALCPAFQRLFATMAEYFTHRDEAEAGRRLYAWAALCAATPARHWLYRSKWERRAGDADQVLEVAEVHIADLLSIAHRQRVRRRCGEGLPPAGLQYFGYGVVRWDQINK